MIAVITFISIGVHHERVSYVRSRNSILALNSKLSARSGPGFKGIMNGTQKGPLFGLSLPILTVAVPCHASW